MKTKRLPFVVALAAFSFLVLQTLNSDAQYTVLHNFTGGTTDGSYPYGSLISDGTYLYGMTQQGGSNGGGTIFKINTGGSGYLKLLDFTGATNGQDPMGSFISDGTNLYGMTWQGGTNNKGAVFKIKPDGSSYLKLLDFAGAANGSAPYYGSLYSDGTYLYGMTTSGGANNDGTIFKIKPDGSGYTLLLSFAGTTNGSMPYNSTLISDGTYLYGMTTGGGANSDGTIFKIKPDGSSYSKLLDFAGTSNGSAPQGSLYYDGTFLYGMTSSGGANNFGTIFKIKPDGTGYTLLLSFAGITNGKTPYGSLISDGTFLYGMTSAGGANSDGAIFEIKPDGTGFTIIYSFTGSHISEPYGSLISDGTFLYGMTEEAGANLYGVVFKQCLPVTINISASTNPICVGNPTTLTASGGSTYSWSGGLGTSNPVTISPTTATTYTVTGTTTAGCTGTGSITVTVNPSPTVAFLLLQTLFVQELRLL